MMPVFPETRELKVDSKAEMADWAMPSASILACSLEVRCYVIDDS
jgi:hypothetical protein